MTISYNKIQPEELSRYGLKQTPSRVGILKMLEKHQKPVDVSEISAYLKKNNIDTNQVTIYRILDVFYKKGIVNRFELEEGKFRYELTAEDHHHILCENCGVIEDVSDCSVDRIEKQINEKKGFLVKRHSLQFYGLCSNCQN